MQKLWYTYRGKQVQLDWSEENENIARMEADGGVYEVCDDGQPETTPAPTQSQRIEELEQALELLLSGVTE